MGKTTFSGPIRAGTIREGASANVGNVIMAQQATITHTQVGVDTSTGIILPAGFRIVDITVDVTTAWNSATSDSLTIGDGTDVDEFGAVADLQTTGRVVVDPDAAQAAVWVDSATTDTTIYTQVTETGASASTGSAIITIRYFQS